MPNTFKKGQKKNAKAVGCMSLFVMGTAAIMQNFIQGEPILATQLEHISNNLLNPETALGLSLVFELLLFSGIVILALASFILLKPADKFLAQLALIWHITGAFIYAMSPVLTLMSLLPLGIENDPNDFALEQTNIFSVLFLVFFSLGSMVNSYTFLKSRYIPKAISLWGIFSCTIVLAGIFSILLNPQFIMYTHPFYLFPMAIFKTALGLWLLFKKVDLTAKGQSNLQIV